MKFAAYRPNIHANAEKMTKRNGKIAAMAKANKIHLWLFGMVFSVAVSGASTAVAAGGAGGSFAVDGEGLGGASVGVCECGVGDEGCDCEEGFHGGGPLF